MDRITKFLAIFLFLTGTIMADQHVLRPTYFDSGSSLTIRSGVTVDFQAGSIVDFTGATVTGLEGLGGGFQPIDPDLTALAALSGTNTIYYRSGANTWTPITIGSNLTFVGGTLAATGGGSGTGDASTDTTSAVVGEAVVFKNTNGKVVGRATGSGVAKLTSGVLGTATSGTDYLAPGAIGSTVQAFDADLSSLAGASGTNTLYYRSASNTWTAVTIGSNLTFTGGTLDSVAAGTGDVTGPAASVDSEFVLYSGTSGKTIKRATATGILKSTAGVAGTASASDVNTLINSTVAPVFANVTSKPNSLAGYGILDGVSAIAATGDVTGTWSAGSIPLTIGAGKVVNSMMANVATSTFKGRTTAGTGPPEDMTVAQAKSLLSLAGSNSGDQTITLTGEGTGTGTGSFAFTLNKTAITNRTEDTTPSLTNDFFLSYDLSADALKKVKMSNIANQLAIDTIKDSVDPTKQLSIDISGFPTGTTYTLTPPAGDSVTVVSSAGSTLEAATGINASGVIAYAPFVSRAVSVLQTAKTGTIATTNYQGSNPAAGLYRITYYVWATTAGTSGTLDITIAFHDGAGSRADVNTGAITFGSLGYATKTVIVRADGAHQVSYAVAANALVGSPVYSFSSVMERLQ